MPAMMSHKARALRLRSQVIWCHLHLNQHPKVLRCHGDKRSGKATAFQASQNRVRNPSCAHSAGSPSSFLALRRRTRNMPNPTATSATRIAHNASNGEEEELVVSGLEGCWRKAFELAENWSVTVWLLGCGVTFGAKGVAFGSSSNKARGPLKESLYSQSSSLTLASIALKESSLNIFNHKWHPLLLPPV